MSREPSTSNLQRLLGETDWFEALARRLVADDAVAEDLVQETWLAATNNRGAAEIRSPRAWLAGVFRRLILDRSRRESRRRRREAAAAGNESLPPTDRLVERAELQRALAAALVDLPEPYRTTVLLRFFEDLAPAEIARRQGIPAGTVRSRLKRGLEQLRVHLDAAHDGERSSWVRALLPFAAPPAKIALFGSATGVVAMKLLVPVAAVVVLAATAAFLWKQSDPGGETAPTTVARSGEASAGEPVEVRNSTTASDESEAAEATRSLAAPDLGVPTIESSAATVRATIVDRSGAVLAGAVLDSETADVTASSDRDGRIEASVPLESTSTVEFRVAGDGFAEHRFHARLEVGDTVELGKITLLPLGHGVGTRARHRWSAGRRRPGRDGDARGIA